MLANNHKNQTFWQLTAVFIGEILTSMLANLSRLVDSYPMCYCIREVPFCIPYGAKFLRSTILVDFADGSSSAKIAPHKTWRDRLIMRTWIWIWIWIICIFIGPFRTVIWLCLQLCVQTMFLRYFSPVSADQKLPDPQGAIARDVPSSSISAANMEVKHMQSEQQNTSKSKRESYAKLSDVQRLR